MVCKIGFLTSRRVNVGDEFIREGIRAILDELSVVYTPLYVHKLSETSLHTLDDDETFIVNDKYWDSDLFIQSGAPVYWHLLNGQSTSLNSVWHQWMWAERILKNKEGRPVFINLGAGSCQPWGDMGDAFLHDADCVQFARAASDRASLTTVRDPVADHLLNVLQLPHEALPCPAFLAACRHHINAQVNRTIGVNLMALGGHYDLRGNFDSALWQNQCFALITELRKTGKLLFIAHDQPEAEFMTNFAVPGERIFLSGDWHDYFDVYAACHIVVANRVHGAVCATGFGVPSIILGNDTRSMIGDYIGIPRYHVRAFDVSEVIQKVRKLLDTQDHEYSRLLELREQAMNRYRDLLGPIIEQVNVSRQNTIKSKRNQYVPLVALASVAEIKSEVFGQFMQQLNAFSTQFALRTFTNWSKVWEYPWLWFHGLSSIDWVNTHVLDFGSELSPMPWFFASLGAQVTLIETDAQWIPIWEKIQHDTGLTVEWKILADEQLPFADHTFDVVTSFSVIEHQGDKVQAVNEVARVLKPGGTFAISFDICEPDMGMTFPEWNGKALTMKAFEEWIWNHPAFDNGGQQPHWNIEDCAEFIQWHLQSAPHHNYVVGAAILTKQNTEMKKQTEKQVNVEQFDLQSCRNILIPRFDTFGDIVLLQGFLQALLDFVPDARVTLLVREGYDQLQSLFPERIQWKTTVLNHHKEIPEVVKVRLFVEELRAEEYDLVLTTTYNRFWTDDLTAAALAPAWRIALGELQAMPDYLNRILLELGIESAPCPYDDSVPVAENLHEIEKYQLFWEKLTANQTHLPDPQLLIPNSVDKKAQEILSCLNLTAGNFVFCLPAGIANVSMKTWPAENFARVLTVLEQEYRLKALVVGHETEKIIVDSVIDLAQQQGAHPESWLGRDGDIPVLSALLQHALFYLGNDSGPMHIAAALNKPVIAVFGGGDWPRFLPCVKTGRVFVLPLPCFSCHWHCLLEETFCVKALCTDFVLKHLKSSIDEIRQAKEHFQVIEQKSSYDQLQSAFEQTIQQFRVQAKKLEESEADRTARLTVLQELGERLGQAEAERNNFQAQLTELQRILIEVEADRAARLEVIQQLGERLGKTEAERNSIQAQLTELQRILIEVEADRAARLEVIHQQGQRLGELEQQLNFIRTQLPLKVLHRLKVITFSDSEKG